MARFELVSRGFIDTREAKLVTKKKEAKFGLGYREFRCIIQICDTNVCANISGVRRG